MRVFVTGASGHIGSAVVPELIQAGNEVTGLARSDASAAVIEAMGAQVRRGDLDDPDGLRAAAADADAVVHLAFDHATMGAGRLRRRGRPPTWPSCRHSATRWRAPARPSSGSACGPAATPQRDAAVNANPRSAVARAVDGLGQRGVRTILVAIPPVTHSAHDKHGFIPMLIKIARDTGVSGYVGEGANRWPAGHTLDVASLYRLALEQAPAGAQLFAAAEEGIEVRRSPRSSAVSWASRP